jgi:transposase
MDHQMIIRRKLDGWRSSDIAAALRVEDRTVHHWWSVYKKYGWEDLAVKSRRPHRFWKTPQESVELILKLRREMRWGPCKIEGYLKNYGGEGVVAVGHNAIHRILIGAGLNNPIEAHRSRPNNSGCEIIMGNYTAVCMVSFVRSLACLPIHDHRFKRISCNSLGWSRRPSFSSTYR